MLKSTKKLMHVLNEIGHCKFEIILLAMSSKLRSLIGVVKDIYVKPRLLAALKVGTGQLDERAANFTL